MDELVLLAAARQLRLSLTEHWNATEGLVQHAWDWLQQAEVPTTEQRLLLEEGVFVKNVASWEAFFRDALSLYMNYAQRMIESFPDDLRPADELLVFQLQSHYSLITSREIKRDRIPLVAQFLRDLASHPTPVNFKADSGFGALDLVELNKQLASIGVGSSSSLLLNPNQSNLLKRVKTKRNDSAHGILVALAPTDFSDTKALLSDLAYQLIDILAEAFEKRQFATR